MGTLHNHTQLSSTDVENYKKIRMTYSDSLSLNHMDCFPKNTQQ